MGYYPEFTSPIESDIFGSNDSLIVRHFVDSLFTATAGLPSLSEAVKELLWLVGARSKVAWMVLPTQVGHCPAAAQLTKCCSRYVAMNVLAYN